MGERPTGELEARLEVGVRDCGSQRRVLGFRVWGFGVWGLGFRGLGFLVWAFWFRVWGLGV